MRLIKDDEEEQRHQLILAGLFAMYGSLLTYKDSATVAKLNWLVEEIAEHIVSLEATIDKLQRETGISYSEKEGN